MSDAVPSALIGFGIQPRREPRRSLAINVVTMCPRHSATMDGLRTRRAQQHHGFGARTLWNSTSVRRGANHDRRQAVANQVSLHRARTLDRQPLVITMRAPGICVVGRRDRFPSLVFHLANVSEDGIRSAGANFASSSLVADLPSPYDIFACTAVPGGPPDVSSPPTADVPIG